MRLFLLRSAADASHELVEMGNGVVRAGRGFGMILDAEYRKGLVPQPLDSAIVQVHVRHFEVGGVPDP